MRITNDLYQAFLEEMHALEGFRATYMDAHEHARLEREDPEVRRLIEAMAFFTARTRLSSLRNLLATRRRLFQQYFSFLLSPLPAMAMLRVGTTGRFAEPAVLPQGAEVAITTEDGRAALFQTLHEMRILPIRQDGLELLARPKAGFRLVLRFKAPYARNDDVGRLSLLVNHLNDYQASLKLFHNLKRHIERAFVAFDEKVTDETVGTPCAVEFGEPGGAEVRPTSPHPIEDVRCFLHLPQRELYVNVTVPDGARNWQRVSLFLDLDATFPAKQQRLNQDDFQLFTVPIVNLRAGPAEPILHDATAERYALRHPERDRGFDLHSVLGVYRLLEKGATPLRPGIVTGGAGSYEVEREAAAAGEDGAEVPYLKVAFPQAFTEPQKIVVEARWHQPWLSEKIASGRFSLGLHDRSIPGVELELAGDLRPHVANPLGGDAEGLLQIVALKNKATLNQDELNVLLGALGILKQSQFRPVPTFLLDVEVTRAPRSRGAGGGLRPIYRLRFKEFEPTFRPLVETFLDQLCRLLNGWVADAGVAVEATIAGSEDVLKYG